MPQPPAAPAPAAPAAVTEAPSGSPKSAGNLHSEIQRPLSLCIRCFIFQAVSFFKPLETRVRCRLQHKIMSRLDAPLPVLPAVPSKESCPPIARSPSSAPMVECGPMAFDKIDVNGDGVLDREEWAHATAKRTQVPPTALSTRWSLLCVSTGIDSGLQPTSSAGTTGAAAGVEARSGASKLPSSGD